MKQLLFVASMALIIAAPRNVSAQASADGIPIVFNLPYDRKSAEVFIQFLDSQMKAWYYDAKGDKHEMENRTSYSMKEITGSKSIATKVPANVPAIYYYAGNGRIWLNYGKTGIKNLKLRDGYTPPANDPSDANYSIPFQFFEANLSGKVFTGNLTYIDYLSMSMSMEAKEAPHAVNGSQLTNDNTRDLAKAAASSAKVPKTNIAPSAATPAPNPKFVRVLAPGQAADGVYHDWSDYMKFLTNKNISLSGCYPGVGPQPATSHNEKKRRQQQGYAFTAIFDDTGNVTITGGADGKAKCVDAKLQGPGVGKNVKITITAAELKSVQGIWGNNPEFVVKEVPDTPEDAGLTERNGNDLYTSVVGDLTAGMSLGYPGSAIQFTLTDGTKKAIGDLASAQWWGKSQLPDMSPNQRIEMKDTPFGKNIAFDKAQPGHPTYYHTYAGSIADLTPGYGFAYQDRMGLNLMTVDRNSDANAYLVITLNPTPKAMPSVLNSLALSQ